ncbi:hypothetical protein N657DRAFT_636913 [Parathielavia appendiculata]|uniref:Uncharacterized protein n=1 Tax=Parathielavia appendiculata TaxID=2587402 RepID=A0AAN6Z035_9PEZI|nr:hypothetical protein N657DRAFT_636913 [Parathielavia appendiculata]
MRQYLEFKQDVEGLKEQLQTLELVIKIGQTRTQALLAHRQPTHSPRQLDAIFGNLKETLEDCRRLLDSRSHYGTRQGQGPVSNIQWFLLVKDEVDMLRDRIAILTSKLSLALQSLEIETRDGQTVLMLECTNVVLERIDLLDDRFSRFLGVPLSTEARRRQIEVPQQLQDLLASITLTRYDSLTSIPMIKGVEEAIFYWDRATRWHARRRSVQPCQAFKLANILRAYWLLQATKAGDEYLAATSTVSVERQIGQQFPQLGMTARRFFSNLEDRILEAHTKLTQTGEQTPPLHQLRTVIEQDINAWQEHVQWQPPSADDSNATSSERMATCRLRNGQLLDVYKEYDAPELLILVLCDANRLKQHHHRVDLGCLHLAPCIEAVMGKDGIYSVTMNPVKGRSQVGFKLAFQGPEDLFEFQEWMTGYKVVDDFPGTVITSQRANAMFGGERRSDTGGVQVWSSTRLSSGSKLPDEFVDKEATKAARRSIQPPTVSPYPPMLGPLASFSRLSLALSQGRPSSVRSVYLNGQISPQRQSRTPSFTGTSTASSPSTSQSSTSSTVGATKRPTNMIQVDRRGTMGCILDQPEPPRLVVFLPSRNETQNQRWKGVTAGPGSLLVIDILTQRPQTVDQYVRINPTLCDCQQDYTSQELGHDRMLSLDSSTAAPGQWMMPPRQAPVTQAECRKVILQVSNASGITARETDMDLGADVSWNLASAGRFQSGEGMVTVKRLKKVALEFASVEEWRETNME